jgi:hypothetical protein
MTEALGLSYLEVMEMPLQKTLCANLDAIEVANRREEALDDDL